MGLSKRIKLFTKFYSDQEHIWDLCCDHGEIGLQFQDYPAVKTIHLVDSVESIVDRLKLRLTTAYIPSDINIKPLTQDCKKLLIPTSNNLIIIAGVGAELGLNIVKNLLSQELNETKIVVSVHNKYLWFRSELLKLPVCLGKEDWVKDQKHFYEMVEISTESQGSTTQNMFPEYFLKQKEDKNIQALALQYYKYYSKAINDPLRSKIMHFFQIHYDAIIKR